MHCVIIHLFSLRRSITLFLLIFSFAIHCLAQAEIFPMNYQVYPRNLSTNKGTVKISGTIQESTNYNELRIKRFRNNSLQKTTSIPLNFTDGQAPYTTTDEIVAELGHYKFELYGIKNESEVLIKRSEYIQAGDAYIIQGQSNAVANLRGTYSAENDANTTANAPNRWYVRVYGSGSSSSAYSKKWQTGNGNVNYDVDGNTGQWGMRMANNLSSAQRIPIVVFNGAFPGAAINYFQRNDNNPEDPNTNYGRLLRRIKEAGFENNIRGVIWYQGESDASGVLNNTQTTTEQYKQRFKDLYNDWKNDYPGVSQFYIIQIRHGCGIYNREGTLQIQEAQRAMGKELPDVTVISPDNTTQLFDGGTIDYCHYSFVDGYKKIGDWLSDLIRRQLYNVTTLPLSTKSPEVTTANISAFTNNEATQLTLSLSDPRTTYSILGNIAQDLKLEGGNYAINAVNLNGNNIIIDFSRSNGTANDPSGISYLSHDYQASPVIINERGLAVLHFQNFPISNGGSEPPPPPPPPPANPCTDTYETNNTSSTARWVPKRTKINAMISSSTDQDWFRFEVYQNNKNLKISFYNLPEDYDIYLYNNSAQLLISSTVTGTSPEALIYNDGANDAYYRMRIVGKNGAFNTASCYSFYIETSTSAWPTNSTPNPVSSLISQSSPMEETASRQPGSLNLIGNIQKSELTLKYSANEAGRIAIRIMDLTGKTLLTRNNSAAKGQNIYQIKTGNIATGIYIVQIIQDNKVTNKKIILGME